MQLVVVMAVTKAVSAATMTFTTISMMCFFLSFIRVRFKISDFRFRISDFRFQDFSTQNPQNFVKREATWEQSPEADSPLSPSQRGKREATLGKARQIQVQQARPR
jgi:hypothetical protein